MLQGQASAGDAARFLHEARILAGLVHPRSPKLWSERHIHAIRMGLLPRRAAESMVQSALGERISAGEVEELIDRSRGNASFPALERGLSGGAEWLGEGSPLGEVPR